MPVEGNLQDRVYVKECLTLCDFAWPMMDVKHSQDHVGDRTLPSKVISAVTGREMGVKELDRIGERVFNLQRAILLREGHEGRKDDVLPECDHTVPLPTSPGLNPKSSLPGKKGAVIYREGMVVDRKKFEKMKDEYYQLRGWDLKTGYFKKEELQALALGDMIEKLQKKVV